MVESIVDRLFVIFAVFVVPYLVQTHYSKKAALLGVFVKIVATILAIAIE